MVAETYFLLYGSGRPCDCNLKCTRLWFHGQACQECHTQGDVEVQGVDGRKLPYTEAVKAECLFLTAEAFLDAPLEK